jgi:hypothetical protein
MRLAILPVLIIILAGCLQQPAPQNASPQIEGLMDKMDYMEDRMDKMQEKIEYLEEKLNGEEAEPQSEPAPPASDAILFQVTVQNVHKSYSLSPGVFIVHRKLTNFNPLGKSATPALADLAEQGNVSAFYDYAKNQSNVFIVYQIKSLAPGENITFMIEASKDRPRETSLSGLMGIIETSDGFSMADSITLFTNNDQPIGSLSKAQNYDAGTKEDGSPTVPPRPVILHTQVPETIMQVTIVPQ